MILSNLKTSLLLMACLLARLGSSVVSAANIVLYRVNAGRDSSYMDTFGNFWDADTNYIISSNATSSVSSSTPIAGATDPTIYRTERNSASSTSEFRYIFTVNSQQQPNDEFLIRLHFAELSSTINEGQRIFNVCINEKLVFSDIDIVKQAGGRRQALVKEVVVKGSDVYNYVNIKFISKVNNAMINAIEVIKIKGSVAPKQLPLYKNGKYYKPIYLMNAGGENYKNYFQLDQQWIGGFKYSNTGLPYRRSVLNQIANTNDCIIYNTARQDKVGTPELVYTFPIDASVLPSSSSSSKFLIRLHFAELEFSNVGQRVFDVDINASPFLTNFDIIKSAQNTPYRAVIKEYELSSSSSSPITQIKIEFWTVMNRPQVNAIEILVEAATPPAWRTTVTNNPLIANHENCFVMASNQKAYLIGGRTYTNTCAYDPTNQTWDCTRKKPPIQLHHMQCVAVHDEIYIPSSWTGNYPYETNVPDIYIYNPTTDTWRTEAGMSSTRLRGGAAAAFFNDTIYVSHGNRGGHGTHSTTLTLFDKYDIKTKIWTALPNANHKRDHTGGGIVNGNKFCVAAGRDGSASNGVNKVVLSTECYDLVGNGGWSIHTNIPGLGQSGAAYGTTCDGKLIVAGGEGFNKAWNNVTVFDGTSWQVYPNLQQGRHGTGLAVSCECNQVHIATGSPKQGGGAVNSTETLFYDGVDTDCRPY